MNKIDKQEILKRLKEGKNFYSFAHDVIRFKDDPEIILAYAQLWPNVVYQEKKEFFRSNREYMKQLMTTNISLDILEKEDLEDTEYMRIALMNRPSNICWMSQQVKNEIIDRDLALYLVRIDGMFLNYLSMFSDDEEIVIEAMKSFPNAILDASQRIKDKLHRIYLKKSDSYESQSQILLNLIQTQTEKLKESEKIIDCLVNQFEGFQFDLEQTAQNLNKVKQKV